MKKSFGPLTVLVVSGLFLTGCGSSPASKAAQPPKTGAASAAMRLPSVAAAPSPIPTPSPAPTPPSAGSVLFRNPDYIEPGGDTSATAAGDATTIAVATSDNGDFSTGNLYILDATGHPIGKVSHSPAIRANCGVAITPSSTGDTILTEAFNDTPATGINNATSATTLTAWTTSGTQRWSTTLFTEPTGQGNADHCPILTTTATPLPRALTPFSTSNDGRWALIQTDSLGPWLIDLTTGTTKTAPPGTVILAGNVLITTAQHTDTGHATVTGIYPATGAIRANHVSPVQTVTTVDQINYNPTVASSDGSHLYYSDPTDGQLVNLDTTTLTATSAPLPTGPTEQSSRDIALDPVSNTPAFAFPNTTVYGFPPGKPAWTVSAVDACGGANSQLLVIANNAYATLDAATGRQLAVTQPGSNPPSGALGGLACPTVLPTGAVFDGTTLTELLAPQ